MCVSLACSESAEWSLVVGVDLDEVLWEVRLPATRSCHSACHSVERSKGHRDRIWSILAWEKERLRASQECGDGDRKLVKGAFAALFAFWVRTLFPWRAPWTWAQQNSSLCENDEPRVQLRGSCRRRLAGKGRVCGQATHRPRTCFKNTLLQVERNLAKGPRSKRLRQYLSEVCCDWMEEQVKVCTLGWHFCAKWGFY